MSLPIKKVYIDSANKTADSTSDSDFKIELLQNYTMPDNSVFFLSDICIPHSWYTVEQNYNDKIYFGTGLNGTTISNWYVATLNYGNYNGQEYADEVARAMNQRVNIFKTTYVTRTHGMTIGTTDSYLIFKIFTDQELLRGSFASYYSTTIFSASTLASFNDTIQNTDNESGTYSILNPYTCDFLKLQLITHIYITSPNIGTYDTISNFSNNTIKGIPVTSDYGYMIIDQSMSPNDFLNCAHQSLKTLEFHLRDSKGRFIPLHGANVTFSLIFNKYNDV